MTDIVRDMGLLMLGSRLRRLGERLQADTQRFIAASGLDIQPSQYPLLAAIDRRGAMSVGDLVETVGISQPGVTRNLARLVEMGLVVMPRSEDDQRQKLVALTDQGHDVVAASKQRVWAPIRAAVAELCGEGAQPLLDQLAVLENRLAADPLDARAARLGVPALRVRPWSDDLAATFEAINAEWIGAMFVLEDDDRDMLGNPRRRIIDKGGDILFVESDDLGIVGTCALMPTGPGQFELTKMGVRESARGRKAGEFLLRATIARADEIGATRLYLLTNARCEAAIHLYEKNGFVHDAGIMQEFGSRYARCDVAMLYAPDGAGSRSA